MEKRLYLKEDALGFVVKSKEQTGEQLGGKYAARVQTGIEKDGSPQYRYFTTQKEYEDYLRTQREGKTGSKSGKGKKESMKERLQSKLKKEQKHSSKVAQEPSSKKVSASHSKNRSLYAGHTASVKKFGVKKGIDLYLGEK